MLRSLLALGLLSALIASPALAQRSTPSRTRSDLRVPDVFRSAGDDAEHGSEMRTPRSWQAPPGQTAARAHAPSADLVIPDIFRRPGDPPPGPHRELRTPGGWTSPAGSGAPAQPPRPESTAREAPPEEPLSELVARADRDGIARVGAYAFTPEELRAALTYLGESTGVQAFVAGAGTELLDRARARARQPSAPPIAHLGRALDRP